MVLREPRHACAAAALALFLLCGVPGCATATITPGHRVLLFDPHNGGLGHEVLAPGEHRLHGAERIDDFDVTYTTRSEACRTITVEGLQVELTVAVTFRPIISELYQLDTEVGPAYYSEVIGPELRSAVLATIAKRSFMDMPKLNMQIEDEVEVDVRKRVAGKHIEITSVSFTDVRMPPEVQKAIRDHITADEEKRAAERAWEKEKREAEHKAELRRIEQGTNGPPSH